MKSNNNEGRDDLELIHINVIRFVGNFAVP